MSSARPVRQRCSRASLAAAFRRLRLNESVGVTAPVVKLGAPEARTDHDRKHRERRSRSQGWPKADTEPPKARSIVRVRITEQTETGKGAADKFAVQPCGDTSPAIGPRPDDDLTMTRVESNQTGLVGGMFVGVRVCVRTRT